MTENQLKALKDYIKASVQVDLYRFASPEDPQFEKWVRNQKDAEYVLNELLDTPEATRPCMTNEEKITELVKMHKRILELGISNAQIDIAFSDAVEELETPETN